MKLSLFLAALGLVLTSCGAPRAQETRLKDVIEAGPAQRENASRAKEPHAQSDSEAPAPKPAPQAPPPAWLGARETRSGAGAYLVRWRTEPAEIPMNDEFSLRAWVFAADAPDVVLRDVELVIDAAMPDHGHGMARAPKFVKRDDGSIEAQGMLFHMPGRWELYFDVSKDELTERAQVHVELE
ncbi:MAG: hypothetical protein L6Q99_18800 [Planctomycetes bacterium]|nr:hypothetical protein [Planctomycetota bacterium]